MRMKNLYLISLFVLTPLLNGCRGPDENMSRGTGGASDAIQNPQDAARELGQIEGVPYLAQINGAHFIIKALLFLAAFASKTPISLFARTAISSILGLTI